MYRSLQRGDFVSQSVEYRIPPVSLPLVHERYYPGVFGDFETVVSRHIEALEAAEPSWLNDEKARFFQYLLATTDADAHRAIQDRHLTNPRPTGALKYIDPVTWFEHKFSFVETLGLHTRQPSRILDLGTGAGHFMKIAQSYGHKVVGTDLPSQNREDDMRLIFTDLLDLYGLTRVDHVVTPELDETGLPQQVDLVTGFSAAFNRDFRGRLWAAADWETFLASLSRRVLKPGGQLYMTLMKKKLDDDVWTYLKSRAVSFDEEKLFILLKPD